MKSLRITLAAILLAPALLVTGPAFAQSGAGDKALADFAAGLPQQTRLEIRRQGAGRFMQSAAQRLFTVSDDGILTPAALELSAKRRAAEARARHLMQFLRYDLDGDLQLSRAETEAQAGWMEAGVKGQLALLFAETGRDFLTLQDLLTSVQNTHEEQTDRMILQLLEMDFNADGSVDLAEVALVVGAVVAEPELADPGRAKPDTTASLEPGEDARRLRCNLPAISGRQDLVLLTGNGAGTLSTLSITGDDRSTSIAMVSVEKSRTPLYVYVASRHAMIWDFSGDVGRVEKLVVELPSDGRGGPAAAVAGIAADRVHFVQSGSCFERMPGGMGKDLNEAAARLREVLKVPVDGLLAQTPFAGVVLAPDGSVKDDPAAAGARARYGSGIELQLGTRRYRLSGEGMVLLDDKGLPVGAPVTDGSLIQDLVRRYPGGISSLDPATLVAPEGAIVPYRVLPVEAGLLQLLAEGRIRPLAGGKYEVVAPIEAYPAGMKDRLVFAEGIAPPAP